MSNYFVRNIIFVRVEHVQKEGRKERFSGNPLEELFVCFIIAFVHRVQAVILISYSLHETTSQTAIYYHVQRII